MHRLRSGRRMSRVAVLALAASAVLSPLTASAPEIATAATTSYVRGADISWPQCPTTVGIPSRRGLDQPMPARTSDFVVVGLTNGPAFYPNPCIEQQMRWVRNHHVFASAYSVTTYPRARQVKRYGASGPFSAGSLVGRLRNTGYNQARFNIATMKGAGLRSPAVWIDVEPSTVIPWSGSVVRNRAVVDGIVRGYKDAGYRVGIYSTRYLWQQILGNARYGLPEWRTAGRATMSSALRKCSSGSVQGGRAVMTQWYTLTRDFDLMCPGYGTRAAMRRWFHKY